MNYRLMTESQKKGEGVKGYHRKQTSHGNNNKKQTCRRVLHGWLKSGIIFTAFEINPEILLGFLITEAFPFYMNL